MRRSARRGAIAIALDAVPSWLAADRVCEQFRAAEQRRLRVIVKADTQGTAEALRDALERLASDEVGLDAVRAAVGAVTESDVHLAIATGARILGFGVARSATPRPSRATTASRSSATT